MQHPDANLLVVRKTGRTLQDSCYRELKWAIHRLGVERWWRCNLSPLEITYIPTGQKIYFRGLDDPLKVTSITVDTGALCWLWIEEAYEITKESDFDILDESIRGQTPPGLWKQITLSFNPWNEKHWIKKRFFDAPPSPDILAMTTNYMCNEWLDDADRRLFEDMKVNRPQRYRVAGLGEWGIVDGLIYEDWREEPFDIQAIRQRPGIKAGFGLDFGYSCFTGETLVKTKRGDIFIRDVKPGDYVITRQGYRRVKKLYRNGTKRVTERTFVAGENSVKIKATENHRINTGGDNWKRFGEIHEGDSLFFASSLTAGYTSDTHTGNTQTIFMQEKTRSAGSMLIFTEKFTAQFRAVMSFIISTGTRLTTVLKTLLPLPRLNMQKFIVRLDSITQTIPNNGKRFVTRKTTGASEERKLTQDLQPIAVSAKDVAMNLHQQTHINGFVQKSATIVGNTPHLNVMRQENAKFADENFKAINTLSRNVVQSNVGINYLELTEVKTGQSEFCEVYDIEVEGVHEYFANGVLVHNCDPSALCCFFLEESTRTIYVYDELYQKQLTNQQLYNKIEAMGYRKERIVADSAEPKSIDELRTLGMNNIRPARKGPDSISHGIQLLQNYHVVIHPRCVNFITEISNYTWAEDKNGNKISQPIDEMNHLMDAWRYGCSEILKKDTFSFE